MNIIHLFLIDRFNIVENPKSLIEWSFLFCSYNSRFYFLFSWKIFHNFLPVVRCLKFQIFWGFERSTPLRKVHVQTIKVLSVFFQVFIPRMFLFWLHTYKIWSYKLSPDWPKFCLASWFSRSLIFCCISRYFLQEILIEEESLVFIPFQVLN